MKAIISLLLLSWTTSAWFSGPYGKAFLDFPLFLVNPLIPFIATILWSLFIFIIWLRRQGNIIRMRIIQCLNQKRKTVFLLCGILAFNLIVIQGHSILNYFGDHDSDSALQGIVGYHIAEGIERPMYVYGWHYVGSIQMHITAIFNWAFGKNPFYKRAIGSIFYSGFLLGFFIFVYRLFKKKTALIVTFIAAIPPFSVAAQLRYDEFIGLSFWGIIGLNLLLSITHSKKDKWNYYFWYGVVLGIQFFVHPQAIYFIITGLLVIIIADKLFLFQWRIWLIPVGFIIGSTPTWIDSYFHKWVIFRSLFGKEVQLASYWLDRLGSGVNKFALNFIELLGIGSKYPLPWAIQNFLLYTIITATICSLIYYIYITRKEIWNIFTSRHSQTSRIIPLVFLLVVSVIFCISFKGAESGCFRYIFVLWMVIPLVIAVSVTLPKSTWGKGIGIGFLLISLLLFSLSHLSYYQKIQDAGKKCKQWFRFCKERNITRFYGNFWLVYNTNFLTKEKIIGSACFPWNNDPYMKYREKVDNYPEPPTYVFSPHLWRASPKKMARFEKSLYHLGIGYTKENIGRHTVYYNLTEHLTPAQLHPISSINSVKFEGFYFQNIDDGKGVSELRLVTIDCHNLGKSILYTEGKRGFPELVITRTDGTILRRQPLNKSVHLGERFSCKLLLSLQEMMKQAIYIHVKLNDIIISENKQPFILKPYQLEFMKSVPGAKGMKDLNFMSLIRKEKLPEFILINGWGKRIRQANHIVQWSGGKKSEILFLVDDPSKGIIIELLLEPFKDEIFKDNKQCLKFFCNNIEIKETYSLEVFSKIKLELPKEMLFIGINRLCIIPSLIEPECRNMRKYPGFNFRPRAFALHKINFLYPIKIL